jgi:hypothetical protein
MAQRNVFTAVPKSVLVELATKAQVVATSWVDDFELKKL